MKTQRPLIAILLVIVFAFNLLGYCVFSVLIVTHKKLVFNKIMYGQIDQKEVSVLKGANLKDAVWEHDTEFELNGEMYDVVKKEFSKDDIIYICKKDIKEDQLIAEKRKAEERSAGTKMIKMTKIFVQPALQHRINFVLSNLRSPLIGVTKDYFFDFSSTLSPPPKV